MKRLGFDNVNFFYGTEVEHTPAYGKKTLFVVGLQSVDDISSNLLGNDHIYFGANMSFPSSPSIEELEKWEKVIGHFLNLGYWCTLDMDVAFLNNFHDGGLCEYRRFIPMISVKIPYIKLFNYNTTIKIDDCDFDSSNPGVWCHRLHNLMDPNKFTNWDQYTKDEIV